MALTVGSLFSGIGGIDLGLERAGMVTRWFVEIDPHCRNVLARHWPGLPIYGDITAVEWSGVEPVDVLAGGFPCQPVSNAGKRLGTADERWLWPEFARAIRTLRPRYVLVENVAALLGRGFEHVITDLAALGYDAEWDCIPAAAVGAPHLRDRLWIVAYARSARRREDTGSASRHEGPDAGRPATDDHEPRRHGTRRTVADASGLRRRKGRPESTRELWRPDVAERSSDVSDPDVIEHKGGSPPNGRSSSTDVLADTDAGRWHGWSWQQRAGGRREPANSGVPHSIFAGLEGHERGVMALSEFRRSHTDPAGPGWWSAEPDVGRVADGIPHRVDRLRSLGNAVVPQVVEWIGRRIVAFDEGRVAA